MKFRPCVDLHDGRVKQIVGSSLDPDNPEELRVNFTSDLSPGDYAAMFKDYGMWGGHTVMLGPGNEAAAIEVLKTYPGAFAVGGGIKPDTAKSWIDAGARAVIISSALFAGGKFSEHSLDIFLKAVSPKEIVLDLSCKNIDGNHRVVTDKWKTITDLVIEEKTLERLSQKCSEFLIHAAHVEGMKSGPDLALVEKLSQWEFRCVYAGGISSMEDIKRFETASMGKLDFTVGSSLDIYGGTGVTLKEIAGLGLN